jgi:hypothetical protein
MAITYPVPAGSRWTVYDKQASAVIARGQSWPRADGMEIQGLSPEIAYLLESEDAQPNYDPRLYRLERNEVLDVDANTATRTWTSVARAVEERKVSAENKEMVELGKHIDLNRETIHTRLVVGAILNHIGGLQLPPKIVRFVDEYEAGAIKLWKNRDRLKALLASIENGEDPDLDAGWEADPNPPPVDPDII